MSPSPKRHRKTRHESWIKVLLLPLLDIAPILPGPEGSSTEEEPTDEELGWLQYDFPPPPPSFPVEQSYYQPRSVSNPWIFITILGLARLVFVVFWSQQPPVMSDMIPTWVPAVGIVLTPFFALAYVTQWNPTTGVNDVLPWSIVIGGFCIDVIVYLVAYKSSRS